MSDASHIAASGLRAQTVRLAGVAQDTANLRSEGRPGAEPGGVQAAYRPVETVQTPQQGGGVKASLRPQPDGTRLRFAPGSPLANDEGLVATPNVSLEQQAAERIQAEAAYKANVKVIEAQKALDDSLSELA
jgi:flagellar basal-body rod protein FlgC